VLINQINYYVVRIHPLVLITPTAFSRFGADSCKTNVLMQPNLGADRIFFGAN